MFEQRFLEGAGFGAGFVCGAIGGIVIMLILLVFCLQIVAMATGKNGKRYRVKL